MKADQVIVREAEALALTLTQAEQALQHEIAELEWPEETSKREEIMSTIENFMISTGASQRRTAVVIGWPETTLRHRLERFRSSGGIDGGAGAHSESNTQVKKAIRLVKAKPQKFVDEVDDETAEKIRQGLETRQKRKQAETQLTDPTTVTLRVIDFIAKTDLGYRDLKDTDVLSVPLVYETLQEHDALIHELLGKEN